MAPLRLPPVARLKVLAAALPVRFSMLAQVPLKDDAVPLSAPLTV